MMVSFTDLRCRRLIQLVEETWRGCTAEIFQATEEKIVFRIRSEKGRYRTSKINLSASESIDRGWLADQVKESLLGT